MQQDSPIKLLQEYARRNQIFLEYRFQNESGPNHARMYTVRLHLGERDYLATESNMKLAQITAAQLALKDLKISSSSEIYSPIVTLNTWAKRNHRFIRYCFLQEQRLPISSNRFRLIYHYRLYFDDDFYFDGFGSTHQQARLHCAQNALYFLRSNSQSPKTFSTETNSLTKLYQLAQNRQVKLEFLQLFDQENDVHIQIKFDEHFSADGYGKTKQLAKQAAAEILVEKLQSTINLPPPPSKGLLKRNGTKTETKKHVHFDENLIDKDKRKSSRSSTVSIKQQLISLCQKLQIQIQYYDEILQETSLSSRYQSSVTLEQKNHHRAEYIGFGPNLIRAQENASSAAWNHLKMCNYSL